MGKAQNPGPPMLMQEGKEITETLETPYFWIHELPPRSPAHVKPKGPPSRQEVGTAAPSGWTENRQRRVK